MAAGRVLKKDLDSRLKAVEERLSELAEGLKRLEEQARAAHAEAEAASAAAQKRRRRPIESPRRKPERIRPPTAMAARTMARS